RTEYRRTLVEHAATLGAPLHAAGRRQLEAHGIHEPLVWSPSAEGPSGGDKSGPDVKGDDPDPPGGVFHLREVGTVSRADMTGKSVNLPNVLDLVRANPASFTAQFKTWQGLFTAEEWLTTGPKLVGSAVKRLVPSYKMRSDTARDVEDMASFFHAAIPFLPPWQPDDYLQTDADHVATSNTSSPPSQAESSAS
ncbi:MAG: hypothetical protein U1C73_10105, partial [Dietzia sp.]|nr:hypothetical protein [Dietzia sp.]